MYINYERSYKKHKRKGKNKTGTIILVILLALGLGLVTYFAVKSQMASGSKTEGVKSEDITEVKLPSQTPTQPVITQPIVQPTATVTPTTVPSPTQLASDPSGDDVHEVDTRVPVKVNGIYVTAPTAGTNLIDNLITLVDHTEINAMVIDVKDDKGKITYAMDNAIARDIGAVTNIIPDIQALIELLKAKDVYLIARIVAFKDPLLADKRQDLAIKNLDGTIYRDNNGDGWVNPYNHQVWDYLVDVATQAAAAGFNEIQFDYIRFSTGLGLSEVDFGEEAKTKSREDIITEFTAYAYEKIKPLGVFLSADVYGTIISSTIDAGLVGQNYVEMSKHLDYICPMIYPSHFGEGNYGIQYPDQEPYNIIRKVLTASQTDLAVIPEGEHRAIVRPWLQAFTATWIAHFIEYGGNEIREQINGVDSVGYDEWLLWNAASNYSEDGLLKE